LKDIKKTKNVKLGKAVYFALKQVVGAYAIVVFDSKNPKEIVGARLGSPLGHWCGRF
jgi:glucosamine--fructose-6-phosphate aminotransferase (isomerizing)